MTRVAAVDCGTNSIRLLIADVSGGEPREIDRRLTIVRLGQGVDATGRFAPEALIRTFAACDDYAAAISAYDVERIRFVATSAARDVANADEFFAGVRKRFHIEPEVITGTEEAVLSFRGATNGLSGVESPYLVADIGGGSTELILGDDTGVEAAQSLDMGSVRMTERHLHSDPVTPDELAAATADIDSLLEATIVPMDRARTLIGLAGTVTTVAALGLDIDTVHHARIDGALLESTTEWLIGSTRAERAARRTIHPGRVDVIGAGALILARLHHHVRTEGVLVSEHDILDGIALGLAEE